MRAMSSADSGREASRDRYPALAREARTILRAIVDEHSVPTLVSSRSWPPPLRGQLAILCAQAKRDTVPIEQLVVSVKQAWRSLPQQRIRLGDLGGEVLTAVVTVCIEEYFADVEPIYRAD
jgi:hypothetical protein